MSTEVPCSASTCSGSNNAIMSLSCDTCRLSFHCICVSVKEELSVLLSRVPGFFWRCPTCSTTDANTIRFEKILTIMESMKQLVPPPTQMASILTNVPEQSNKSDEDAMDVSNIVEGVTTILRTKRSHSTTPSIMQTIKSRRLDFNAADPDETTGENVHNTAPTNILDDIISSEPDTDLNACVMQKYDRYLYISKFKPDTSADKIRDFIVGKLNCSSDSIICQKLISAKRNPDLPLSFVSFKIGTCKKMAKKILKNGFWPAGLTAKAFEDRSKNANPPPRQGVSRLQPAQPQHQRQKQRQSNMMNTVNHPNPNTTQGRGHRNCQAPVPRLRQRHQTTSSMAWRVSQK